MPKLVTKKIRKVIQNHVSLNCKIIEFHCNNNGFDSLEGCMCERERYQKNIKNETKIHLKAYEKHIQKHARKRHAEIMKKHPKVNQKGR